jgi:hypothetical protein
MSTEPGANRPAVSRWRIALTVGWAATVYLAYLAGYLA